jgi:hypothetical protein
LFTSKQNDETVHVHETVQTKNLSQFRRFSSHPATKKRARSVQIRSRTDQANTVINKKFMICLPFPDSPRCLYWRKNSERGDGNLPDFPPLCLTYCKTIFCVNFPKLLSTNTYFQFVKIPRYFYIFLVFSNTILHVFSIIAPIFARNTFII